MTLIGALYYVPGCYPIIACPQGITFLHYGHSWFLLLKSISNPNYSLTFKVSVSAARKKRPQPIQSSRSHYAPVNCMPHLPLCGDRWG